MSALEFYAQASADFAGKLAANERLVQRAIQQCQPLA